MQHLVDNLTERDKERLKEKLLLILQPLLLQLKGHSKAVDKGVTRRYRTAKELIGTVEVLSTFYIKGPAEERCLECRNPRCAAWVALYCGGCGRTFWLEQSGIWDLWCETCRYGYTWERNWQRELRRQTGLDTVSALSLFESLEQKILAYYWWEVQCIVKRVDAQSKSYIATARCRQLVPLTQHSVIGPFKGDPDKALDSCIGTFQRLGLQKLGSVRLKADKKGRAKRKTEK